MFKPGGEMLPVTDRLIGEVLANVRTEDKREFEAIQQWPVERELRHAIEQSEHARVFACDGVAVAIFGCIRYDDRIGVPWLISTHQVPSCRRAFLKHCLLEVAQMRKRYAALINYTDARYTLALRWMVWMGFDQQEAVPYGACGELFHPFTMKGDLWAQQQALPQVAAS
jgi:hypothetical protein